MCVFVCVFESFVAIHSLVVVRLSKKSCSLGYNYSLRDANKNRKGTQVVGHCYDLFLGHFKSKTDIFGDFACKKIH